MWGPRPCSGRRASSSGHALYRDFSFRCSQFWIHGLGRGTYRRDNPACADRPCRHWARRWPRDLVHCVKPQLSAVSLAWRGSLGSPIPWARAGTSIVVRHDGTVTRELTLPPDYPALLADLKARVRAAQHRAHRAVNTEMLTLYWQIGDAIRTRQEAAGWGGTWCSRLSSE